jgi:serine/threonine protein kinase
VRTDGYGADRHFVYTTDSDIYALAIVCYEFMVGMHPYFFQTSIDTDTEYKKANGLSLLDYLEGNRAKVGAFRFTVFENAAYRAAARRLWDLKAKYSELYEFFKAIFVDELRVYFSMNAGPTYDLAIKAAAIEDDISSTTIIPMSKEDPEELGLFVKQFGLDALDL